MTKEELLKKLTKDELVKLLQDRGDTVYIADRDLVRFAKFAVALIAFFAVLGTFFFGFDIKKGAEDAKKAAEEARKSQSDITSTVSALQADLKNLEAAKKQTAEAQREFQEFVAKGKLEIKAAIDEATESSRRTLGIEQQVTIVAVRMEKYGSDAKGTVPIVASGQSERSLGVVPSPIRVALVSEVKALSQTDLARIAAALQKQVERDLQPIWGVKGTVEAFADQTEIPRGYWPIIIKRDIGVGGALGVHLDKNGEPFALVTYSEKMDQMTLTASHEMLGMLVDPFGNRLVNAPSPKPEDNGKIVGYLVEIAQPVEGTKRAYTIDGVMVSDFVTPAFYGIAASKDRKYSLTGAAKVPGQILQDGYMTWHDMTTGEWWQVTWFGGDKPQYRNLGKLTEK